MFEYQYGIFEAVQYLTIWDVLLTPVYLVILHAIAKRMRDKRYAPGHPLRKYYLPGLWAKFGGAIFIGLVYQFYYGGGDTFNFFFHSKVINSALTNDGIGTWWKLITRTSVYEAPELNPYVAQMYWYNSPSEYTVAVIGAVLGLFNFTTYLPIALLFAILSYSGIWAMFRTFSNLYPELHKQLAIAFLFIPSVVVWGSGFFKDTLCMFGLGWLTYTVFRIFRQRDLSVRNVALLISSFIVVAKVKLYILMGFLPALVLWLLISYSKKIKTTTVRWLINIAAFAVVAGGFIFFANLFAEELNKYSLERIAKTVKVTQGWTAFAAGDEGSVYSLGEIGDDAGSMLTKFPQAVAVTFFRPFPWEIKKIIVALSGVEALLFIYFTLQVLFRKGALKYFVRDPNVLFCITFALIFAFAVGISSGNFGALSRYKIPCLPFYVAVLAIVWGQTQAPAVHAKMKQKPFQHQPVM